METQIIINKPKFLKISSSKLIRFRIEEVVLITHHEDKESPIIHFTKESKLGSCEILSRSLRMIEERLQKFKTMKRCHTSYIINTLNIDYIEDKHIYMLNGMIAPVGVTYGKHLLETILTLTQKS
jgi:DNA-binding LytR/AlgR family response regulator